jgi:4-amino-4-deoxy-L-arabinose transferase-like glycosyltransferase
MLLTLRHLAVITAVGLLVLFTNLGGPRLWDRDEPRNARCTVEMLERGDLITPVFNGELRTHKPILLYWLMMTAYGVFGVSEFAARFWSAAMGLGTAFLTYALARRMFSAQLGLWAALILISTLMFDVAARAATPDGLLIFWSTAALAVYVADTFAGPACRGNGPAIPIRLFPRWHIAALMYGLMGMGILAKGPVGLVLPTAVIGMYLLIMRLPPRQPVAGGLRQQLVDRIVRILRPFEPRHFLRTCWAMRPITALGVSLAVALPWYVAVGLRTDGQWVRGFLMDHNLGRAAQSLEGHSGTWLFYPVALLVGFFPWSVFAVPTTLDTSRRLRRHGESTAPYLLSVCWIGVYLGVFSVAQTKLPSYITPCYPAVAVLVASFLVAWTHHRSLCASLWTHAALIVLAAVGLGIAFAAAWASARYVPGEEHLALIGCLPMLTAAIAYGFIRAGQRLRAAAVFCSGAVLLTTCLFAFGAARVDRHQTFDAFVAAAFDRSDQPRLGSLGVLEPSWVFYMGRPIDDLFAPELTADAAPDTSVLDTRPKQPWQSKPTLNVWHYLNEGPNRFVITTSSHLSKLSQLPPEVEVISRTPYFLRDDELVLLGHRSARTAARREPGEPQRRR